MGVAMKQFIDRFKAMEKIANETLAENPEALVGVDSLPGSEHDAKVPEDAKKPNEEVAQGQPAGAASTTGAVNGGDAKPLNEGKLEVDEPLLNPEQKPLITDDALTAKTANAHLASLVSDLLADIKGGAQKQASAADPEKKPMTQTKEEKVASGRNEIRLDDDTISKIAAAQAVFAAGRKAAENVVKQAQAPDLSPDAARKLIKAACVKAAQEQGLDPAAAAAAADNAMATAGMAPEEAAAADAGAAEAAAADAGADAAAADAASGADVGIPEDVSEEELATAIVDLVSSGELDPESAKALVEEIAGDEDAAGPTEDEAAEIIARGLESGEITPEQAQEIAATIEGEGAAGAGDAEAPAADAGAGAEAEGAAAAEQAIQDAQDEAQGAAAAEEAIKSAAAAVRRDAITKVANAVVSNRIKKQASAAPRPGQRILAKVAGVLEAHKAAQQSQAPGKEGRFIAGFKKKAEEMGYDPKALAKYVCDSQAK